MGQRRADINFSRERFPIETCPSLGLGLCINLHAINRQRHLGNSTGIQWRKYLEGGGGGGGGWSSGFALLLTITFKLRIISQNI